jgi:hypothetical protein
MLRREVLEDVAGLELLELVNLNEGILLFLEV